MAIFTCPECGHAISNQAITCPNCGAPINAAYYVMKRKIPGKGLGISGMVLGIIGVFYSFFTMISAIITVADDNWINRYMRNDTAISFIVAGVYCLIFGILSMVFGGVAYSKGYRNGVSTSGLVMGVITAVLCFALIGLGIANMS